MKKIGFIGLGIMGKPMVKNLLRDGFEVYIFDINKVVVDELVELGAIYSELKDMGKKVSRIIMILPNGEIVKKVIFDKNGLIENLSEGNIVCDMSSVTPEESRYCYEYLNIKGIGFIDAPVSGGEPGAINGTLAIMCGGDEEVFLKMQDVFNVLGNSSLLIGPSGSGSITKLANQIIVNLNIAAVSEALVLAKKCGADPYKVYEAIRGGLAGSSVLDAKAPMMCQRNFNPGGKISINHKDIKNVINTAHNAMVPMPFTAQLYEVMQSLMINGHENDDHAGIIQYFEGLADIKI